MSRVHTVSAPGSASATASEAARTRASRGPSGGSGQATRADPGSSGFSSSSGASGSALGAMRPTCWISRRNAPGPRGFCCVDQNEPLSSRSDRVRVIATYASRRCSAALRSSSSSPNASIASANSFCVSAPRHASDGSSAESPRNSKGRAPNATQPRFSRSVPGSSPSTMRGTATTSHSRPFEPWIVRICTVPGSGSSVRGARLSRRSASASHARNGPRVPAESPWR